MDFIISETNKGKKSLLHDGYIYRIDYTLKDGFISIIFQLYHGGKFYWWRKSEDQDKTTALSQVNENLYHIML